MKSHVSDLLELATCIYQDAIAKCTDVQPFNRDLVTLRSRVEREGLSFLTITLPTFGKDLDRSLSNGYVDPTFFRSFKKNGSIPAFLQGMTGQVFDKETGRIFDEPKIEAIEGIRQFANAFKKIKIACTPKRVKAAFDGFVADEHIFDEDTDPLYIEKFINVSRILWGQCFDIDFDIFNDTVPKHGPGATAEKLSGNAKFKVDRYHDRLEPYFPILDTMFANANCVSDEELEKVTIVKEQDEQPVRVIAVPKTLKTPRIIAIEPVCMQYTQQALAGYVVKRLGEYDITRGHINFDDQSVNRSLAINSSKTGEFATLDLSAASDRVPFSLAIRMFDWCPDLQGAIIASRSTRAEVPDWGVIPIKKFASMGSALCFPIESMYFYTICVVALLGLHDLPVTYFNIRRVAKCVYVYGDDIVVPTDSSEAVIVALQKYYCKVNTDKSFFKGNFRESCGMDAFNGEEVTPRYIRELPPGSRQDASAIISWVKTSNLLYRKGYWKTSNYMLNRVERYVGKLPIVGENCSGLGKVSFQPIVSSRRWNEKLHRHEVRTVVAAPVYIPDELNEHYALIKSLLSLERKSESDEGAVDKRHLSRSARHGAVTLKSRWVAPY